MKFLSNFNPFNRPDFGVFEEGDGGAAGERAVLDLGLLRQVVGQVDRRHLRNKVRSQLV